MTADRVDEGDPQDTVQMPRIRLRAGLLLTLLFLATFSIATIQAWQWPYIAQLMPLYFVALPGIVLCVVQLYRDLIGWRQEDERKQGGVQMDEVLRSGPDAWTELRRTLVFFGWVTAAAFGIWLLGMTVALPLLALAYPLLDGREKWSVSLLLAGGTFLFLWGLFEYILNIRWPPGVLFSY